MCVYIYIYTQLHHVGSSPCILKSSIILQDVLGMLRADNAGGRSGQYSKVHERRIDMYHSAIIYRYIPIIIK